MGILSRQAISRRIAAGEITISPAPKSDDFDSDSVDVHLGDQVYEWARTPTASTVSISLWKKPPEEFSYKALSREYLRKVNPDNAGIITLRPQVFYLADLQQETKLPPDVAMHIQGKSSLARLGILIHLTAPHAHAGWDGRLTLEVYNLGPFNIEMKPGMVIGQLTFFSVDEPESTAMVPPGQFDGQQTAHGTQ